MLQNKESDRRAQHHGQLGQQKVTFSGERQTRNQPTGLKESERRRAHLQLVTGWRRKLGDEETNLCRESELSAGTAPKQPVWHKETSRRQYKLKGFQTESVPRWLTQVNTNPEIPSGRSGLESRLTSPQTYHQLYNAHWFRWRRQVLAGWGEKSLCLQFLKCSYLFFL